jgi:hypothetical protein
MMDKKSVYRGVYNKKKMGKKGGLTDLFLVMIFAIILVFVSGIFIYIGITTEDSLHENMGDINLPSGQNVTEVIDNSFNELNNSLSALYWIAIFLIVAMMLSVFVGNYLVTTKPVFFLPYIFIVIIAIIVSVGISIGYSQVVDKSPADLQEIFGKFIGSEIILQYLPIWIAVLGIGGGVIMFVRMGSGQEQPMYYG